MAERGIRAAYEADPTHRAKHRGSMPEARIEQDSDGHLVGKCSSEIDDIIANNLFAEGVPWSPRTHRSPLPLSVFNTYKGVPYRAHRRGSTRFYHGFPEVKNRIPKAVREQ